LVFCGYSTSADKLTEQAYGMQFYLVPEPEEPQDTGDLVTSLSQLTDGAKVMIYSPSHKTAISSKPNGDWYLKAENATVEDGKPVNFTKELIWTVTQENGEYVFTADADTSRVISVWPSGTYAELTVNPEYNEETVHGWNLQPFSTADHTWYIKSSTLTLTKNNTELAVYIEAYIRNDFEVFSGYAPYSNQLSNTDYALQFYLVNPEDAVEGFDDGEWDGILNKGESYVAYNFAAESSIGLFKEANYAMDAIPTTIEGDVAVPGNGAYVFTVDTMGRYYSFELNGKYLATNNEEELLFVEKDENGVLPDTAKWFLQPKEGGYIIYNKEASYGGTPVCIEYYSSVFSGWTYSPKNDVNIDLFKFYKAAEDTKIVDGVVQDPKVIYDGDTIHHPEEDYKGAFSLDDLAESIVEISIYLNIKGKQIPITDYESDESGKTYKFTVPAETIDAEGLQDGETFELHVEVKNSYAIEYEGVLEIPVVDEPFFYDEKPEAGSQTGEDKKPVVSVKVGNVGENPEFTMVLSGETVETVYEDKTVSYTPAEDMEDGFYTVTVTVKREDGKEVNFSWGFYVGDAKYQRYFGQLHSHTTYSDGSGSLETALDYIANLPESANVQFVAFTDHSNYFDTTSASNPADAMNDKSLMTDASRALWEQYKNTVAEFNAEHKGLVAIAGYEMTWSGGPGHINSFSTDGLVSRNNAALNNKSGDAGMKLYYETMIKDPATIQQFNHPGTTFGNFTDFAYWTEEYDRNMFLVEVGNGEGQIGAGGYYPSYEQYDLALSKGWHVAPTNNQDNHKGRWGNANDARDVVLADKLTEEDIYNAIRALRVYSTEDKNLEIDYTVNDMPMGTIFSEDEPVETMNVVITLFDPDKSDGFSKVELIVDGGRTAYTWNDASELAAGELTAQLDPEYSYYYVKVTQKDGDLAVTAPIWVTKAAKVGVTEIKPADEKVYTGKETTLVTTLFNNEEKAATVKSLTYTVNGSEVIGTDTTERTLAAGGTLDVEFKHTFDAAKVTKVTVTAVIEYDG
ncbi:MAG: hypothetical protein IIY44_08060, partial [Erysipelotrichales bacterium]|nr:hypothetical protein [Erysipelotrichales bacterium]